MSEGPKLYVNKPKKAQLKQHQQQRASAPSSMASSGSSTASQAASASAPPPPTPPPQPPKESFARRYKFIWPLLLAVNFTVGAYLFTRTKKKDVGTDEAEAIDVPNTPVPTSAGSAKVTEQSPPQPPPAAAVMEHANLHAPIPEDQQRELFKWILEEKRKVKPKDPEEKKRIDEEKAILKQFIRAKSIPSL